MALFDEPSLEASASPGLPPLPAQGAAAEPLPPAPPAGLGFDVPAPQQAGLGMAPQAPPPPASADTEEQQYLQSLPVAQKLGLALQAFSAGVAGQPNPINTILEQRRKAKATMKAELGENMRNLGMGMEILDKLQPGSQQYTAMSEMLARKMPDFAGAFQGHGQGRSGKVRAIASVLSSTEAQDVLVKASGGDPATAQRLLADGDFVQKMLIPAADGAALPVALAKIKSIANIVRQLPGPEMKDAEGNVVFTMADLYERNKQLPPELKLSDGQLQAVARNQTAAVIYGMKTDKTIQAEQEAAARLDVNDPKAPQMRTRVVGENEVQEEWDPKTKTWKQIGQGPRFAKQVQTPEGPVLTQEQQQLTGDAFLATLEPADAKLVKRIAAGIQDVKDLSTRGGHREKFVKWASQYDETYNSADYPTMRGVERAFTVGMEGRRVRSFNVALEHLDTLDHLVAALNNGNIQQFNRLAQYLAEQTGRDAPTNFDAAKQIVADETIAAIVAGGGALADREEAAKAWDRAKSPQQLAGASKTIKELMGGQLKGLHQQYKAGGGTKDFSAFLTEAGKRASGIKPTAKPAAASGGKYQEGQTATGPGGKKLIFQGGKWQPL
jgi:hypothetical protein